MESAIKMSTQFFCMYINNLMCFLFFIWLQVNLNKIYQRIVELEINIKMLVPCQSALVLLRNFFKVKLTFEILAVRGQQHSFLTHERVFLGRCQTSSNCLWQILWDDYSLDSFTHLSWTSKCTAILHSYFTLEPVSPWHGCVSNTRSTWFCWRTVLQSGSGWDLVILHVSRVLLRWVDKKTGWYNTFWKFIFLMVLYVQLTYFSLELITPHWSTRWFSYFR